MKTKILIPVIVVGLLLVGGIVYLALSLNQQRQENQAMQELAEIDKREMENEYQQFANQYGEMKTKINNDFILTKKKTTTLSSPSSPPNRSVPSSCSRNSRIPKRRTQER